MPTSSWSPLKLTMFSAWGNLSAQLWRPTSSCLPIHQAHRNKLSMVQAAIMIVTA